MTRRASGRSAHGSRVVLVALTALGAAACTGVVDATAPGTAPGAQLNVALATETGTSMVCGSSAPVSVIATTTDRRGKVVPAVGVVLNFKAMNANTELFAGAAATNAAGQASDRVTASPIPGRPVSLEVRSVDAATGVPTTHLALTRPVVMPTTASLSAYSSQYATSFATIYFSVVKVNTGCVGADGKPVNLPANTPVTFTRPDGTTASGALSGDLAITVINSTDFGKTMSVTIGDASTGTLSLTYTIDAVAPTTPPCTSPISCITI